MNNKKILAASVSVLASVLLLLYGNSAAAGVMKGITLCAGTVIPSLFLSLCVSNYLSYSGVGQLIFSPLSRPVSFLFGIPKDAAYVFFIGMIGGYPSGAVAVKNACDKGEISRKSASLMLCCSVNAGPAFLITAVGERMAGSFSVGVMLYLSFFITDILLGIILRGQQKKCSVPILPEHFESGGKLVESVRKSATGVIMITSFVCAACGIISVMEKIFGSVSPYIQGLIEITGGSNALCGENLFMLAPAMGFCSLSVILQISEIAHKSDIDTRPFVYSRLFCSTCSYLIFRILYLFFGDAQAVFLGRSKVIYELNRISPLCGVFTLLLAIFALLGVDKKRKTV